MGVSSGVGLISGIDTESLISKLMALNQQPITLIQRHETILNTKSQAYQTLSDKLTALRDQLNVMLKPADFAFRSASSSDTNVLDITADKTAAVGTYSVKVLQVAQAHRLASQGVADLDAPIATTDGTVTIQVGSGVVQNYSVSATTTLTDLRDAINTDTTSGVRASIINDGSATNPYRLVLTAKNTGASNAINILTNDTTLDLANNTIEAAAAASGNSFDGTVTSSGTYTGTGTTNVVIKVTQAGGVDGADAAKFVVSLDGGLTYGSTVYSAQSTAQDVSGGLGIQVAFAAGTTDFAVNDRFTIDAFDPTLTSAADAIISVDGIQITRSTNTFSDVISGVTLTAKSASSTAATVSVENQVGLLNAEIIKFQSAYNALVTSMNDLSAYDKDNKTARPLFGDSALRMIKSTLAAIITDPVSGVSSAHNTLASLGLTLQANGTLGFDSTKMNDALENDLASIMKIFGRIGESTSSQVVFVNSTDKTAARAHAVNITTAAARAQVDGAQPLATTGLAQDELLTFTNDGETFAVNLAAGDKIDSVVSKINAAFTAQGVGLQATNSGGALRIQTVAYGASAQFSAISDRDSGTNTQLGIGITTRTSTGVDVAGTINGAAAQGTGQTLTGATGTDAEGLELQVTATAPLTATMTLTSGVADRMLGKIEAYVDSDGGVLKTRQDGIADTIKSLDERISTLEERITKETVRLRAQFLAMEQQLAKLQGVGDYVANQLSQLQTMITG